LLVGSLNAGIGGAAAPVLVVVHNALAAAALALLAQLASQRPSGLGETLRTGA
jgi:hypothetical protein